ncbi:hypothetical protein Pfo_014003 [Paulownia fortunei]|nr:hypothetical protein Pfo_014003 [Paulownia fortunei]
MTSYYVSDTNGVTAGFTDPANDFTSPYFLHPSDNPGVVIAVSMALNVKNKSSFIDDSLQIAPLLSPVLYNCWEWANNLVLSWILNSISKDIMQSLLYFTTAKDIWDELRTRYAISDGPMVFHFNKSLSSISQGNQPITSYYNQFKGPWDEYISYRPIIKCTCGSCSCNISTQMAVTQQNNSVIKFLVGLHESYAQIRSQLLLSSPIPSLAKVYSLLLQEETQRGLNNSNQPKPKCSHCGFSGHTVDKCFKIIGYPPGWKGPKGSRIASDSTTANAAFLAYAKSRQSTHVVNSAVVNHSTTTSISGTISSCNVDMRTLKMIGPTEEKCGLYHLRLPSIASMSSLDCTLRHSRLGHISTKRLVLLPHISSTYKKFDSCDMCHFAKQRKLPFSTSTSSSNAIFDLIHCDIWGPFSTASHNGFKCTWVYMKTKSETKTHLLAFYNLSLYNKTPDDSHFRIFGCLSYASTLTAQRTKFEPRAKKYVFIGYPIGSKGYKLYDIDNNKVFISRNVQFCEYIFPFHKLQQQLDQERPLLLNSTNL